MNRTYAERFAELPLAPLWSSVPLLKDSADPFDFKQRMAVYKTLIECMNGRGVFGAENEWNVFWGYVFQLEWQLRSGRLQLQNTPPDRIDPNSMWGYGNYSLSVIPYMAAAQVGIVPQIEFLPPNTSTEVEYPHGGGTAGAYQIPPVFGEALRAWGDFFKLVQQFEPGKDIEPMRFVQWHVHHRSLDAAEAGIRVLGERHASRDELDFLIGWIRMVDFLGSAAWRTDLIYTLDNGIGTLPERADHRRGCAGVNPRYGRAGQQQRQEHHRPNTPVEAPFRLQSLALETRHAQSSGARRSAADARRDLQPLAEKRQGAAQTAALYAGAVSA